MKKTTAQPLRGIGRRALPAAMAALLALAMAPALAPQAATAAEAPEAQAQELVLSDGYAYRHSIAGFCDWLLESGKMGSDSYRLLLQDVENAKAGRADLRTEGVLAPVGRGEGKLAKLAATDLGQMEDATFLANVEGTIEFLRECNELRRNDEHFTGRGDLKVSPSLMLVASIQINATAQAMRDGDGFDHSKVYNVGENIAYGYHDSFDGWYHDEKACWEAEQAGGDALAAHLAACRSHQVGHYLNLMSDSYATMGFGITGTFHGQVFTHDRLADAMTVDEFAQCLSEYRATLTEPDPGPGPGAGEGYQGFSDVAPDAWYASDEVVGYVVDQGLIKGYDDRTFGPEDPVTRGQVATILYRMAGEPVVSDLAPVFVDVNYTQFYGPAIRWARARGVVSGYADPDGISRRFGPDDPVSREQLATMLRNYAEKVASCDTFSTGAKVDAMPDASSVSDWAYYSLGWAMDQGLISGDTSTGTPRVNPQGTALRCQMAKMVAVLHRDVIG